MASSLSFPAANTFVSVADSMLTEDVRFKELERRQTQLTSCCVADGVLELAAHECPKLRAVAVVSSTFDLVFSASKV